MRSPMLDALAALRLRWLRASPAYPGSPDALAAHKDMLADVAEHGQIAVCTAPSGQLGAAVLTRHEDQSQTYCAPLTTLIAHHDGSAQALAWLADRLQRVVPSLGADVECMVPAADHHTRAMLAALGLGPNTVSLAGHVGLARDRLIQRWDPPRDLSALGLVLEPARPHNADAIVDLLGRVFAKEPAFAWFMTHAAWRDRRRAELRRGDLPELCQLIRLEGQVLGLIEGKLRTKDVHHGSSIGIGLVLAPPLRGRGIALVAYRHCLELAQASGVEWIKRATGRRSVLHMAQIMGRQPTGVFMRRQPRFDDGRFDAMLGRAQQA